MTPALASSNLRRKIMYTVVFLDDTGPNRLDPFQQSFHAVDEPSFLSLPYRFLTTYAALETRLARECRFLRVPLSPPRAGTQPGLVRQLDVGAALDDAKAVLGLGPDLVALSLYVWNSERALRTAALCKQLDPGVTIVAGGPEVAGDVRSLLEKRHALDAVVVGEGERSFRRLLWCLALDSGSLDEIPAVVCRGRDGTIRGDGRADHLDDLDELPSVILPFGRPEVVRGGVGYLETARGCPNGCSYCQYGRGNRRVRAQGVPRVLADLAHLRRLGVGRLSFVEPAFTVNAQRALPILEYLIDEYVEARVILELNLDQVARPLMAPLRELVEKGRLFCVTGVQSVNLRTLAANGRVSDLGRFRENGRVLFDGGMAGEYDVMMGLPGDGLGDVLETLDFGYELLPGLRPNIFPVLALPGTPLRESARTTGVVFDPDPPYHVLETASFSAADMRRAWIVYRVARRLVEPVLVAGKLLGLDLSRLYRELFSESCFEYTGSAGFASTAADLFHVGRSLRSYVFGRTENAAERALLGELVDLATLLCPEYDADMDPAFLALPSAVSSGPGAIFLPSPVFRFETFPHLREIVHALLERDLEAVLADGDSEEEVFLVLDGRRKSFLGRNALERFRSAGPGFAGA